LEPPVTEAESRQLCSSEITFFHPAFGVSGYAPEDALRIWDLLERPDERVEQWNGARAGEPAMLTLQVITLAAPPSRDDLYGDAPKEIGSQPLTKLPPSPTEPKTNPWAISRRKLKELFARGVAGLTRRAPGTKGTRRTWVNKLEEWAGRQLRAAQEQVEHLRNKELHRLLHLLENDPDAGLRHAISMNQFAHRGTTPPGAQLRERPLEFDPNQMGGKAADFWSIEPDLEARLRRTYREMAGRELRQGRYRRAAYIFGELLGDLVSAANALEQGGFYREAALLYEDHLRNPRQAAQCLAKGGLLVEALERYEKLELWLEVAELHERLGQCEAASAALRKVIDQRLAAGDIVAAAKLVEERLGRTDEAIALLLNAWPNSAQATLCLEAAFELLGRHGRHQVVLEHLARLRREPVPSRLVMLLIAMLTGCSRQYPDERVRHLAADRARVLISQQLAQPALPLEHGREALRHLIRLAPEDRLLGRDANGHMALRTAVQVRRAQASVPNPGQAPVALRRFLLPRKARWLQVRSAGPWFFALGCTTEELILVRGTWEGQYQTMSWTNGVDWKLLMRLGTILEVANATFVAVATNVGGALIPQKFAPAGGILSYGCEAGTPHWLSGLSRPFVFGQGQAWSIHVAGGEAILSCHNSKGNLLNTLEITEELLHEAERSGEARICLSSFGDGVAVALGNRLVICRGHRVVMQLGLPSEARALYPTLAHTRAGVVIVMEHGALVQWAGNRDWLELDRDLLEPRAGFVPGGPLVLVSGNRGLALDVDARGVQSMARFEPACRAPIAVAETASPAQFALFDEFGEVVVYHVPR
jgi:tetratricopeptide (TPR) repeat protein